MVCLLPVSGMMAEDLVSEDTNVISNETQDLVSEDTNLISNETQDDSVADNNEDTAVINSLEEIPDINVEENLDQQVVVVYADSSENNVKSLAINSNDVQSGEQVSDRVDILEVADGVSVDDLISELKASPEVLAVDRNKRIEVSDLPNDPYIQNGKAWQFEKIGADKTWNKVSNTEPVVVAVIDSGLNVSHPDFQGKIAAGYDYVNNTANVIDMSGHGTMVSGCIAAVNNNGIGIAGIGGVSDIKIAPYRTGGVSQNDNELLLGYICAGIMDAANRPEVKVINMSFGGYDDYPTLKTALEYAANKGKVLVAAAGNEGNLAGYAGRYSYPASYNSVISVGATTEGNGYADFSQYNDQVDLSAPGLLIYTTTMNGDYSYASGTSFSAPVISGSCAVLSAGNPNLTALEIENILKETALDLGSPGKDNYFGEGLVQLDTALERAVPTIPVDDLDLTYRTHVQNIGWQGWREEGAISGTSGQALRLEAIETKVDNSVYDIGVEYQTHVQNVGWQNWKSDGEMSGTSGKSLRLEAIKLKLTGTDQGKYDVYYQVHAENYGWLDWAKNGENAGTEGLSLRLEAIKVVVVLKGASAPGPTTRPFIK